MAAMATFSTARFNADGGYRITGIRGTDSPEFSRFLDGLDDAGRRPVDVYDQAIAGGELADLFAPLADAPFSRVEVVEPGRLAGIVRQGLGDQWIIGSRSDDRLRGSQRDDVIFAESGEDAVSGRGGDDFVSGGNGRDRLSGGEGDDILHGGGGRDVIDGGAGDDIIRVGADEDVANGGDGADTFLYAARDFDGRPRTDVITDFEGGEGDQIVDETGDLRVLETGFIAAMDAEGTLLGNRRGDALLFVEDARIERGDILRTYRTPESDLGDGVSIDGAQRFSGPVIPDVELRVQISAAFNDGVNDVENYDVYVINNTGSTVSNLGDLKIRFEDIDGVEIANANSATFARGGFDVGAGVVFADGETRIFGFQAYDRPRNVKLDGDRADIGGFRPRDGDGDVIATGTGFELTTRVVESHQGGASVEVFMKNIGSETLVDLDAMEFRFDDDVRRIVSTWGVETFDDKFAVSPWAMDVPHGPLEPGDRAKLFGFSFKAVSGDVPSRVVDAADFTLTSNFLDLLS